MRWTIGKKLGLGFSLVLLIFAISGLVTIIQIRKISKNLDMIIDVGNPISTASYEMEINMMETGFALQSYLVDRDPTHLDRIKDAEEDFDRFLKEYQRLTETEKEKEMETKLSSIYDAFKEKTAALINSEDSQDQKIVALLENYKKIDDILDDSIQISIRRNDPQRYEKTRVSMEMEININGIAKGLGNYLRTKQAQYEDRVTEDESEFKQALREYEGLTLSTQERQWARQVRSFFEDTAKIAGEIIKLDKEITIDEAEFVKLRRDMDVLMDDEIQAQADKDLIAEEEEARASITTANVLTLVLLLGGIIIGSIAATVITRGITNPLRIVVNRVDEIAGAAGDLTAKVPEASKDESGDLAKAFNKMLGGLKGIVIKVVGSSQSITASSQQLSASSQQTNASVQQVSSTIQQLAKGAQTQAQMVEDTIRIMEELNVSISQGTQSAQKAASASSQATQSAQKGAETVRDAIETMDKIEKATDVSSGAVTKLGERSEQMAQIVNMITSVADQTNLLALNAAIEAARAGEAGRGFAVVAEEVRKLAESSSKSAEEIDQLIKETISETEAAVKNMDLSMKEVASGKEMITSTGAALEEIMQSSQNVSSMLQQISAASQQMSSGAEQVTKSVEEVATIAEEASASTQQASASTQQMVATMQEMASSAQSLAQMGSDLNSLVAEFKTGEEERITRPEAPVPRLRPIKPIAERLAEARKKMGRIRRPELSATEEETKPRN